VDLAALQHTRAAQLQPVSSSALTQCIQCAHTAQTVHAHSAYSARTQRKQCMHTAHTVQSIRHFTFSAMASWQSSLKCTTSPCLTLVPHASHQQLPRQGADSHGVVGSGIYVIAHFLSTQPRMSSPSSNNREPATCKQPQWNLGSNDARPCIDSPSQIAYRGPTWTSYRTRSRECTARSSPKGIGQESPPIGVAADHPSL
jgi:hypothetical protein